MLGSRSHSRSRLSTMPVRRHAPVVVVPRSTKYAAHHDYGIDDSISRAGYLSNAVLEDTYEAANRSRGKDNELMRSVHAAIVSTEQHSSPRAAAVSRRVRASTAPPAPRPLPGQAIHHQYPKVAEPLYARQSPVGPFVVVLDPNSSYSPINHNPIASKPVVLYETEAPWYARARAGSVPPIDYRVARDATLPPRPRRSVPTMYRPQQPLPSSTLWAHRPMPMSLRTARASSVEPPRRASYYDEPLYFDPVQPVQTWPTKPKTPVSSAVRLARAKVEQMSPYHSALRRWASEPRDLDRASDYYYTVPDVKERALARYLYAHRGRFGPTTKPPRPSLGNFPQVYVPWKGPGPSNRSKPRPPVRSAPRPAPTPTKVVRVIRPVYRPRPPPVYAPPVRLSSPARPPIPPVKIKPLQPLERPKTPSTVRYMYRKLI